jgi:leucyl aminopeptidase (aminopeptidase T)
MIRRLDRGGDLKENDLGKIARRAVEDYLGVKAGERFLIVADTLTSPSLAPALASVANALGADPVIAVMTRRERSGEEPPAPIAAAMVEADAVIALASRSCYHTEAKGAAQAAGTRGVFNAPSQEDAWINGAMTADFLQLREVALRLADALRGASTVRVTSPAGTDVSMSIAGREPKGWLTGICRNPGEISAFPGGEVSLPPVEGTASGTIVVERVMTDIGAIATPITWVVEDGLVVDIRGGAEAEQLREHVDGVENATNIGEIGIGTNPLARITNDNTETKKRLGTAHIAMGDSAGGYGGTVVSDVHLDGIVMTPRIEVDGRVIADEGLITV